MTRRMGWAALSVMSLFLTASTPTAWCAPAGTNPPVVHTDRTSKPQRAVQSAPSAFNFTIPIALAEHANQPPAKSDWIAPLISGVFAFLGSLLVLWAALGNTSRTISANLKATESLIHQKANEAELTSIQTRLTDFYGPYRQRSGESLLLVEELRSRQSDTETFRTLVALQDPAWRDTLSVEDRVLVSEIVAIGEELRTLIRDKAGLAHPILQEHLARAATHFKLLSLAFGGALNDPARFARYVYPREIDGTMKAAVEHLEARARLLRSRPSEAHTLAAELQLPAECALPPLFEPVAP